MAEIKARLQEQSTNCLNAYTVWVDNKKDVQARENLREAIHELRKVSSRLEIELAISEREEMSQKRIQPPHHRDAKKRAENNQDSANDISFGEDDFEAPSESAMAAGQKRRARRRTPRKEGNGNS